MTDTPWEPPLAGTEIEQLPASLDRMRWTFRFKADGLDTAGLQATIGASTLTLGGLLKHLALMEDHYFGPQLTGIPLEAHWDPDDDELTSAATNTPQELYRLYDEAVTRSRERLDAIVADGLDQPVHAASREGVHASLRRLLCDMVEEYGRHTGHADLLREAVDGRVGEDPPPGWLPTDGG